MGVDLAVRDVHAPGLCGSIINRLLASEFMGLISIVMLHNNISNLAYVRNPAELCLPCMVYMHGRHVIPTVSSGIKTTNIK